MPSPTRCLTAGDAFSFVRDRAIRRPSGPPMVGFELEWLTYSSDDPVRRVSAAELRVVIDDLDLPCGGATSIEPGGQIELSTKPSPSLPAAIEAAITDAKVLRTALADVGITTAAEPVDRTRAPARVVKSARYDAMETYFDALGSEGRTMMCNTASLQVNVDAAGDPGTAWCAYTAAAPLLPALFTSGGHPNRRLIWEAIDASRTAPVVGDDAGDAWARYALDARVMFIRTADDHCEPVLDGMTFQRWIADGHPHGWPTFDDLAEHLTTLFPPVRPRGFLELRTLDALPDEQWPTAVATAAAVVLDEHAAAHIARANGTLTPSGLLDIVRPALTRLGVCA